MMPNTLLREHTLVVEYLDSLPGEPTPIEPEPADSRSHSWKEVWNTVITGSYHGTLLEL
jgi:hypothetical protein